jgi:pimeloyl-ACP methyl ester carboxylesterase
MHLKKAVFVVIFTVIVVTLPLTTSLKSLVKIVNAQPPSCNNGVIMPSTPSNALPAILIHGYNEDSGVWVQWDPLLKHDGIPFCTMSFHPDDKCGTAVAHANELSQIVHRVKSLTGQSRVNIVGHSKGGLDARVYLAQSGSNDVANLIMIGTPNGGDPLADDTIRFNAFNPYFYFFPSFFCTPALFDLETFADDTHVRENHNTQYYTIYGNWTPSLPCRLLGLENLGYAILHNEGKDPNDGIVPEESVESLTNYTSLGHTLHCHTDLLSNQEYDKSKSILTSGK